MHARQSEGDKGLWIAGNKVSLLGLLAKKSLQLIAEEEQSFKKEVSRKKCRAATLVLGLFLFPWCLLLSLVVGALALFGLHIAPMAGVPFAVRALVGTLPAGVQTTPEPISLKAILDDFQRQLEDVPVARFIENIMQTGASTFVIHCPSPREAEEVIA